MQKSFASYSTQDTITELSGHLKTLATDLMKILNDMVFYLSIIILGGIEV